MLPMTREWVDKAEGDWAVLNREIQVQSTPSYDIVCFLAQQCAEKYLKARLQEDMTAFPKTHDLSLLLTLVLPTQPLWSVLEPLVRVLKNYAVRYRYPGDNASKIEADEAQRFCESVRDAVRSSFGLPL